MGCIRNNEFVIDPDTGSCLTPGIVDNIQFDSRSRYEYLSYALRSLIRALQGKYDSVSADGVVRTDTCQIPAHVTIRVLDAVTFCLSDFLSGQMEAALADASGGSDEGSFEMAVNETLYRVDCIAACLELLHESTSPRPDIRDTAYIESILEMVVGNILSHPQ